MIGDGRSENDVPPKYAVRNPQTAALTHQKSAIINR